MTDTAYRLEDCIDQRRVYRGMRELEVSPRCPRTNAYVVRVYDAAFGVWASDTSDADLLESAPGLFPFTVHELDCSLDESIRRTRVVVPQVG